MKKSVARYMADGPNGKIDLEILLDIDREVTDIDRNNIGKQMQNIITSLLEESININPKNKIIANDEKIGIINCFGDRVIFVDEIPNGYDSSFYSKHLPWFIVTTIKGRIKIGWRKRVINIDWSDSIIKDDADTLFPDEDVTKHQKSIHAWGYDKAKEYINILLK